MAPKAKSKSKSPGKKKPGKKKSSAVVVSQSTEMSKEQMEELIVHLGEELKRVREDKRIFKLESEKNQSVWETCRRDMERVKDVLRQRHREREEFQQRHRVEISVYKEKMKHVLSEQHNTVSELKMDTAASASLIQNQHTESELVLRSDTMQADAREKTLRNKKFIEELKLKHQVELLEMTDNYDRRNRELEVKFNEKMHTTIEVEERKRKSEVNELDDRMAARVVALTEDHGRALKVAQEYYSSIQNKVLADEKVLKEEAAEALKQLTRVDKQLSVAQRENKHLRESLHETQQQLPELRAQLQEYNQTKAKMVKSGARAKVAEKELWDLNIEHELLRQASEKVQEECDELQRKQTEVKLALQQKRGLEHLRLEMRLAALTETVETREGQLRAALSTAAATDTEKSRAANMLKETLESKRVTIAALEEDLDQGHMEYEQLLQTSTRRLRALGVPLHDFPFRPAKQRPRVNKLYARVQKTARS
ncbi:dynein regulatory complex subunit 4-like [Hippoglossus hippoglossus]|uniref:dynein regulatory complex subunit 4-like n=1 Tax=Hippoglossus hippoglossus TaxID=8267 RepID=UPI00148DA5DA|nr:dynein regulatory complex subunit 4-like [Hippoglossus hippoglossus]XP_035002765.1 dynein regulatory complex subunit 4 [Hippoglossus stenolepis]